MFQIAIEIIVRKNKQINKALKTKEHLQSEKLGVWKFPGRLHTTSIRK